MAHEDSQNRGPLKVSSRPLRPGKRPKKSSSNPLRKSRKVLPWWGSGPPPHERWPGISFDFKPVFSTLRDRWPPLGGQYQDTLAVAEMAAAVKGEGRRWVTYYRSLLQNWAERDAVSKFTCPQMAFRGRQDEFVARGHTVRIGPLMAEHRDELERMGWTVRSDVVIPVIREFLDPILLRA